ncbi:MAG: hypothetical protein ACE15D_11335 [Candidatus Eisenbacteria bacterium]
MLKQKEFSVSDLAELLEMDRRTVLRRIHAVKPTRTHGRTRLWTLPPILQAIYGGSGDPRARLAEARARKVEIEVEQLEERLVDAHAVARRVEELGRRLQRRLLEIPARVAPQIAGMSDVGAIERLLRDEITRVLNEHCADDFFDSPAREKKEATR